MYVVSQKPKNETTPNTNNQKNQKTVEGGFTIVTLAGRGALVDEDGL